jgi:hypothetical protein
MRSRSRAGDPRRDRVVREHIFRRRVGPVLDADIPIRIRNEGSTADFLKLSFADVCLKTRNLVREKLNFTLDRRCS